MKALLPFMLVCLSYVAEHRCVSPEKQREKYTSLDELPEAELRNLLNNTMNSVLKSLNFLHQVEEKLNVDGLAGVRMVQAVLGAILKNEPKDMKRRLGEDIVTYLHVLKKMCHQLGKEVIPYLKKSDPTYYCSLKDFVSEKFWMNDKLSVTRDTDPNLISKKVSRKETVRESQSDKCMGDLLGTRKSCVRKPPCKITKECWALMTASGYRGYSLTHEILYIMAGHMKSCGKKMDAVAAMNGQRSTAYLVAKFCANLLPQTVDRFEKKFRDYGKDLFAETGAICGIYGYREFFPKEWINVVLSWQHKNGCYGQLDQWKSYVKAARKSDDYFKRSYQVRSRSKREEVKLKDGCLAHFTSVSIGYVGASLRFLIESLLRSSQ